MSFWLVPKHLLVRNKTGSVSLWLSRTCSRLGCGTLQYLFLAATRSRQTQNSLITTGSLTKVPHFIKKTRTDLPSYVQSSKPWKLALLIEIKLSLLTGAAWPLVCKNVCLFVVGQSAMCSQRAQEQLSQLIPKSLVVQRCVWGEIKLGSAPLTTNCLRWLTESLCCKKETSKRAACQHGRSIYSNPSISSSVTDSLSNPIPSVDTHTQTHFPWRI